MHPTNSHLSAVIAARQAFTTFVLLCLLFSAHLLSAQNFTVSGTVKDAANGEDLIGALIGIAEMPGKGTATNSYGFSSVDLVAVS